MAGTRPHLKLIPEACDLCGACLEACSKGALKIGRGYVFVDWAACGGCTACATACDRGAITVRGASADASRAAVRDGRARSQRSPRPGDSGVASEGAVTTIPRKDCAGAFGSHIRWTIPEIAGVIAAAIALLVAKDFVLSSQAARSLTVQGLVALRAVAQVVNYGVLLALLAWLARRRGTAFREAFGLVRPRHAVSAVAWVVAGLLAVRLLATMYGTLAQGMGWEPPVRTGSDLTIWFGGDVVGLVLAMVTVVVIGPFVEEVVFRGMLLPALSQRVDRWTAIVASALLFAASHLTLWTFVPLAMLGVTLGWLASAKGSVWPAIFLHGLYNAIAVLAAFYVAGAVGG